MKVLALYCLLAIALTVVTSIAIVGIWWALRGRENEGNPRL